MKKALMILFAVALIWSCSDKEETPENTDTPQELCDSLAPTYEGHIATIMNTNCGPCHIANSQAGHNVSNYNNTKTAAQKTVFIKAIKHEAGVEAMPKNAAKLSDDEIQLIECWINRGYPQN